MKLQRNNAVSAKPNPAGRLDILAYRLATEHLLPAIEKQSGLSGIAEHLAPLAEAIIADTLPSKSIFPKARRRLC